MKRIIPLMLSAALVGSVAAGCAREQSPELIPAQSITSLPIPIPKEPPLLPPEPPVPQWVVDQVAVPDFLNEEQLLLYRRAYTAAQFLLTGCTENVDDFPLANGSTPAPQPERSYEQVQLNGVPYQISVGRYARWDDFEGMMDSIFTPGCKQSLLTPCEDCPPTFTATEDGALCFQSAGAGCNLFYEAAGLPDAFELLLESDTRLDFKVIGHYLDEEREEPVYTEEFLISMLLTPKGWRLDEFHLPY